MVQNKGTNVVQNKSWNVSRDNGWNVGRDKGWNVVVPQKGWKVVLPEKDPKVARGKAKRTVQGQGMVRKAAWIEGWKAVQGEECSNFQNQVQLSPECL